MGRSLLDLGYVPSLDEIYHTIDKTTSTKLLRIARDIFDESMLSYLIMEPEHKLVTNGHAVLV
jgi:hypothetical protein